MTEDYLKPKHEYTPQPIESLTEADADSDEDTDEQCSGKKAKPKILLQKGWELLKQVPPGAAYNLCEFLLHEYERKEKDKRIERQLEKLSFYSPLSEAHYVNVAYEVLARTLLPDNKTFSKTATSFSKSTDPETLQRVRSVISSPEALENFLVAADRLRDYRLDLIHLTTTTSQLAYFRTSAEEMLFIYGASDMHLHIAVAYYIIKNANYLIDW